MLSLRGSADLTYAIVQNAPFDNAASSVEALGNALGSQA